MNLVIDQGNSLSKIGVFDGDTLLFSDSGSNLNDLLDDVFCNYPEVSHGIFSSVGSFDNLDLFVSYNTISWLLFTTNTSIPLINKYGSPVTLGLDRIAAGVGALAFYPSRDILVIDAGTAITYEFISSRREYLGGNISPGMNMRYRALHTFTAKLPLLEPGAPYISFGQDTASAIRLGVEMGIVYEIEGTIQHFKSLFPEGLIVITGGDAKFFEKKLKCRIFAQPDLVLTGLNQILNHNIENKLF